MQSISRGESFGAKLGSGLGELAGYKIGQLLKKHQQEQERSDFIKLWEPKLGKPSATFLSNFSPEERRNMMQDYTSLLQLNEPPSSADQTRGMQSLGMAPQQQMPDQQQNFLQGIQNRFTNQSVGQRPQEQEGSLLSGLMGAQPQQPQQQAMQQAQQQSPEQQLTPERAKLIENLFKTPQQRAAAQKLEIEQKKEARAEQGAVLKEKQFNIAATKSYVDDLKNKEKVIKENNLRLKKMEKTINDGNLPNANLWSFLTKIEDSPLSGAGAGALLGSAIGTSFLPGVGTAIGSGLGGAIGGMISPLAGAAKSWIKAGSPDIEEFEKLSNEFVKGAKQYFGSKITEKEVQMYMQTVPTLMQTDAGKRKIIGNIRSLNELVEIEAKAVRSIIAANRGIPPLDIEQQVQDKISHKIDKVAKKFLEI